MSEVSAPPCSSGDGVQAYPGVNGASPVFGRVGSLRYHGDVEELMGWNFSQGWLWDSNSGIEIRGNKRGLGHSGLHQSQLVGTGAQGAAPGAFLTSLSCPPLLQHAQLSLSLQRKVLGKDKDRPGHVREMPSG